MDIYLILVFPVFWILRVLIYVFIYIASCTAKEKSITETFIKAKPTTPLIMLFCTFLFYFSARNFIGNPDEMFEKLYLSFSIASLIINVIIYSLYCKKKGLINISKSLKRRMIINIAFDIILILIVIDGINNPFYSVFRERAE